MADKDNPLENAETLWKMLDDLAESNPEGYKNFMDKMLKDNKDWLKPPEPVFCIRTLKLPESSNHHIFINICKWDNVAPPKNGGDRISVIASDLRDIPDCTSKHSVIDLCFHSEILTKALVSNVNHCSKILGPMAIDYIESREGIKLLRPYKVLTIKYKGDVKELKKFVFPGGHKKTQAKPVSRTDQSVLQGLSNIVEQRNDSKSSALPDELNIRGKQKDIGTVGQKKPLIEEVSTAVKVKSKPPPKYHLEVVEAINGPGCIVVVVDLPKVKSGVECQLDVSKDDLLLSSPYNANLNISLPDKGNEDETTSTFDKTTHQLTITIPISSK